MAAAAWSNAERLETALKPTIGFVGLGHMGNPLCRQVLSRGYDVWIFDINPEAVSALGDTTARPASTLRELAQAADVVLLSLPNSAIVEQVVLGDDGLIAGFSAGNVLIDTSSSRPTSTRHIAAELAKRQVDMLDAPVSGGVLRAKEGALAVMVGGQRTVFEQHRQLLETFGKQVFYVGGHGAGHMAKALNNLMSAATLASAAEAVLLGIRAGLDAGTLIEVVNASSGRSNSTEVKFPRYILNGAFDDGFAVSLMTKDLKIALDTASELGQPMLIGTVVGQVWQSAMAQGFGDASHTAIYTFLDRLAGQRPEESGAYGG
ncbi:MAG TPA: NAD(P)-dependent oxidoreductase [Ktedonobacterales bacterium]|nr:NAD(P)-dependent oxidoreductase [Ktedonobacterales bacterium]